MNHDDLERLLSESFDRQARASVGEGATPPRPRFLDRPAPGRHRVARWAAPLAAAAAVVGVVIGIAVVQSPSSPTGSGTVANPPGPLPASSTAPSVRTSESVAPGASVHISSAVLSDGSRVGVGMPIIVLLSRPITDARAFADATTVTVNGAKADGAWYFEKKYGDPGHPLEADYRTAKYWPGHAKIHLDLPARGLSAGPGLTFENNLTLSFTTGPANIVTVDDATHQVTVSSDGKVWRRFPTSLGSPSTPTKRGIKVIMEKGKQISMRGPGYYDPHVQWTQRLTYDGEYLHAAPWNTYNIDHGIDSSNGCTNLRTPDAKRLFDFLEVGDVVEYPNASGPLMTLGAGYGDWNVSWQQWQTGGAVPTH